jgi:hypothetical protein
MLNGNVHWSSPRLAQTKLPINADATYKTGPVLPVDRGCSNDQHRTCAGVSEKEVMHQQQMTNDRDLKAASKDNL